MATVIKGTPTNGAGEIVVLDGSGRLPAVNGGQVTGIIPDQGGRAGKFLHTNGVSYSWEHPYVNPVRYTTGNYYLPLGATIPASGGIIITSTKIYYAKIYIHTAQLFTGISCVVGTLVAGKVIRMGIYTNDDYFSNTPATLILDAGTVSFATTGVKTLSINQYLNPGYYWLCCCTDSTATGVATSMASPNVATSAGYDYLLGIHGLPTPQYTASTNISTYSPIFYDASFTYGNLPATAPSTSLTASGSVPIMALKV